MDYSEFRAAAAKGSAVSVNHRALITRALTKYPVDYALFRELLQNSADAQATAATIEFETSERTFDVSKLHSLPITRLKFSNNGNDFAESDWKRLREIASGNPNETKIGAFGVGFYSVFELTDEPLVHSGSKVMNFQYSGDQLQYLSATTKTYQKGTLIDLPYKHKDALPDLVGFIGFLSQSFLLGSLQTITVKVKYADGNVTDLLHLSKGEQRLPNMSLPHGLNSKTPRGILKLSQLQQSEVKVSLRYLNATQQPPLNMNRGILSFGKQLFTSLVTDSGDPLQYTTLQCTLTKVDCTADVNVSTKFRSQMIETLLKPPPKKAVMSLILAADNDLKGPLKSYVLPENYNDAKIFIGFPTKQSTGLHSNLAINQLVPTLERTDIDMSNSFVKEWNQEMLYMAGIMARCTYEHEVGKLLNDTEAALKVCRRFEFGESAPDRRIGDYIQSGFWNASKQTLVPTTRGVVPNSEAKLAGGAAPFLRQVPVVADEKLGQKLKGLGMIREVSKVEIIADVRASPLTVAMAAKFIRWALYWGDKEAVRVMAVQTSSATYSFEVVKYFLDRPKLPDDEVAATLPPSCIPAELANELSVKALTETGIVPLDIVTWTEFRIKSPEANLLPVLQVIARTWNRISGGHREVLRNMLQKVKCVPTQAGPQYPHQAYIRPINLFPQLPVVLTSAQLPDSWLLDIGARESMDMALVLEALEGHTLVWNNKDLLQYLVDNLRALKPSDWQTLRDGKFFTCKGDKRLCAARDLYPRDPMLKALGFPIIDLSEWDPRSEFARCLKHIGMRFHPPADVLFARGNTDLALRYFFQHHAEAPYSVQDVANLSIVPLENPGAKARVKPLACFSSKEMMAFNLPVMKQGLDAAKLGVPKSPRLSWLLNRVLDHPSAYLADPANCEVCLAYFAQHAGQISDSDIERCRKMRFIPFRRGDQIEWVAPSSVYLPYTGVDSEDEDRLRPLLMTITPTRATLPFYQALGVSDRVNILQIVEKLVTTPAAVYNLFTDVLHYEDLLMLIDKKWPTLSKQSQLVSAMQESPFLLGIRNLDGKQEYSLYRASKLVIVDDVLALNQFRSQVVICPQHDSLEKFYARLGVPRLSTLIQEKVAVGRPVNNEKVRADLETRISERVQLFRMNTGNAIKKNLKPITVQLVDRIELQHQLAQFPPIRLKTTAVMRSEGLLAVTSAYEWTDIANAIAKHILEKPDRDSAIVLEVQLSESLDMLERKGYNVERIRQMARTTKVFKPLIADDDDSSAGNAKHELSTRGPSALEKSTRARTPAGSTGAQTPVGPTRGTSGRTISRTPTPPPSRGFLKSGAISSGGSGIQNVAPSVTSGSATSGSATSGSGGWGVASLLSSLNLMPSESQRTHSPQQSALSPHEQDSLSPYQQQSLSPFQQQVSQGSLPPNRDPDFASVGDVRQTLRRGLSAARECTESRFVSSAHVDVPQPPQMMDSHQPSDLNFVKTLDSGVKIFAAAGENEPQMDEDVLAYTLMELCDIFGYPKKAISIYREAGGATLAFNRNGSLFFNSCRPLSVESPLDHFFPIMAHELAHNLVESHGSRHSFYEESYIQNALSAFVRRR